MDETPSEQLGKYTLDRRIAYGGMAEIFLATDDLGRQCVIKRMLPNLQVDSQFARMFLDEAKLVVQLNHPQIAQVYDFGEDKGVLYLAMEWVDGTNLRAIVKDFARRNIKIPVEYCARLVSQAALALGYAHRASGIDGKPLKIIHRDVSPQNILLGHKGQVKLIDFGVAKATSATQHTEVGMIKGKFAYMSPEQLRGSPLDGRSDIFGLGLVMYELLAAERAVPGSTEAEIAQNALTMRFPPIEQKRPDLPGALKAILGRALAKDRARRYETADEMAAELEAFIAPRMPKLSGAELAKLIPLEPGLTKDSGSQAPIAVNDRHSANAPTIPTRNAIAATEQVPGLRREGFDPKPAVDPPSSSGSLPSSQFWNPGAWENVAKTVVNPPGLVPKPLNSPKPFGRQAADPSIFAHTELTHRDPIQKAPSRLKWFLLAILVGFGLAAVAWRFLQ